MKSSTTSTSLLNVMTATSTRREASGSVVRSRQNVCNPSLRAAMGAPCMEPDVSSSSTHGQRGSGFSANSTASSNKDGPAISPSLSWPAPAKQGRGKFYLHYTTNSNDAPDGRTARSASSNHTPNDKRSAYRDIGGRSQRRGRSWRQGDETTADRL